MKNEHSSLNPCTAIDSYRDQAINRINEKILESFPEIFQKYGEEGLKRSEEDIEFHLLYLKTAVCLEDKELFLDYTGWLKRYFLSIGLPADWTLKTLKIVRIGLAETIPIEKAIPILSVMDHSIDNFAAIQVKVNSFISSCNHLNVLASQYVNSLLRKDRYMAEKLVVDAVSSGIPVKEVYLNVFQPAQWEVGRLWQENKISVAMEHYFTAATQFIMSRLYSYIFSSEKNGRSMVATSVSGELHELGIRMVSDFFELEGWSTVFLGANTPHRSIVDMIRETNAEVLAISATIPFNLPKVGELIQFVRTDFPQHDLKIIVGGKPFNTNPDIWKKLGADGFAPDAESAIKEATRLIS